MQKKSRKLEQCHRNGNGVKRMKTNRLWTTLNFQAPQKKMRRDRQNALGPSQLPALDTIHQNHISPQQHKQTPPPKTPKTIRNDVLSFHPYEEMCLKAFQYQSNLTQTIITILYSSNISPH